MTTNLHQQKRDLIQVRLSDISYLRSATVEELQYIAMHTEALNCTRFEIIFHKGDASEHIFHVQSGIVKVSVHSYVAKEVIRSIVHANMIFGQASLCGEKERSAIAQVLNKNTEILKISSAALKKIFVQNGAVATDFLEIIGNKLRSTESRLESIIVEDARTRVINFLKENAITFGNKVGFNELLLKHSFTQQDIADFTGTSRQTVTTVLNDLKRSNIISLNRKRILIRDFAQLS